MAVFGLLGYLFHKFGCEPAPMMLGFILGPMMEEFLRRALLLLAKGSRVLVTRPISAVMLAMSAILLFIVLTPALRRKREEAFAEEEVNASTRSATNHSVLAVAFFAARSFTAYYPAVVSFDWHSGWWATTLMARGICAQAFTDGSMSW
mgnify:CR=1 FL=1